MIFENIETHTLLEPWSNSMAVYIARETHIGREIAKVDKYGNLEWEKIDRGLEPYPTFRIPADVWQSMVDQLAEKTPPTKKAEIDGELKATKIHLSDMRDLVFAKFISGQNKCQKSSE